MNNESPRDLYDALSAWERHRAAVAKAEARIMALRDDLGNHLHNLREIERRAVPLMVAAGPTAFEANGGVYVIRDGGIVKLASVWAGTVPIPPDADPAPAPVPDAGNDALAAAGREFIPGRMPDPCDCATSTPPLSATLGPVT